MKNKYTKEIIIAVILVILLIILSDPLGVFQITMVHMTILGLAVVFFGLLASLVLREKAIDEREEKHRSLAGRAAFLVGSSFLLLGILVQVVSDRLDVWLIIALVAMIVTKIIVRINSELNK